MEEIAKALAEGFNAKYPDVAIDVQLGGSSTGVKNAQEGVSDIGNVSRALKDTETGLDSRDHRPGRNRRHRQHRKPH